VLTGVAVGTTVMLASQSILAPAWPVSFGKGLVLTYGTTFAEVRDLGWVLSQWDGQYYWGLTFAAGLLPIPASVSTFKDDYVLSKLSKRIVGIPDSFPMGGLRISLFGEGLLNWGYPGVIVLGLLLGLVMAKFDWSYLRLRKRQDISWLTVYPLAYVYSMVCSQLYLSGSTLIPDSTLGLLIVFATYWAASFFCRRAPRATRVPFDVSRRGGARGLG